MKWTEVVVRWLALCGPARVASYVALVVWLRVVCSCLLLFLWVSNLIDFAEIDISALWVHRLCLAAREN